MTLVDDKKLVSTARELSIHTPLSAGMILKLCDRIEAKEKALKAADELADAVKAEQSLELTDSEWIAAKNRTIAAETAYRKAREGKV